jgi:hypothetical protein
MSNISNQHDGNLDTQTNETRNAFDAYRANYQLLGSWSVGADEGNASKKFRRVP